MARVFCVKRTNEGGGAGDRTMHDRSIRVTRKSLLVECNTAYVRLVHVGHALLICPYRQMDKNMKYWHLKYLIEVSIHDIVTLLMTRHRIIKQGNT